MRARPPTPPGGGLVRLDTAGPFRSLPWRVRSTDQDGRCRRAIGRGMMGPTPQAEHLGEGCQPPIRGDVAGDRGTSGQRGVRRGLLWPGQDGEPDQGAATSLVRRSDQCRDDAGQSDPVVLLVDRLHRAGGVAAIGPDWDLDGPGTMLGGCPRIAFVRLSQVR